MKITRNGNEYKLTYAELMAASEEYDFINRIEDVKAKAKELGVSITEKEAEEIASTIDHELSKSDLYFEAIWLVIEEAIKNYVNKREESEDEV